MPNYSEIDAPLWTIEEAKAEIDRIEQLIRDVSSKPVGVGVPGAGNAHFAGRLTDLRKERAIWVQRWKEAVEFEKACRTGKRRSSLQGPRQIIE